MESSDDSTAATPSVRDAAHAKSDARDRCSSDLADAVYLLTAVADRIESLAMPDADDPLHATHRLATMARERIESARTTLEELA